MIQEVLKSIEGVAIFPMIGLLLFVGGFIAIMIITWRMKPGEVDYVSRLPLDDSAPESAKDNSREVGRK
jgi:cbb3-type cytochrome oxidase subunit 3